MNKATFNNLINLEYPDGFKELTEIENEKYFSGDLLRISFQDKERHILLSLSKSKNSFVNYFIKNVTVAVGSLSNMEKNLKDYEYIEEYESLVLDKDALTECFSYTASDEGVKQYGELTIFKIKNAFYVIYCISRYDNLDDNKEIFREFKESFRYLDS